MTEPIVPADQLEYQHRSVLVRTLGAMPPWKRKLLGLSLVIGMIGLVTQAASAILHHRSTNPQVVQTAPNTPTNTTPAADNTTAMPSNSRGFVGGSPAPSSVNAPASTTDGAAPTAAEPTTTETVTPWMTRVGLSFFVGIVVGTVFRTFLKLAAGLTVLAAGGIAALSYFHIANVDFTSVQTHYASASAWLHDQAYRLKDVVFSALPSTTSAAAGFLSGFKRR